MTETRRYYWLKLQHDFFNSKRIKKLRKLAGGDTYTIIYLKMQLKSLTTDGILTYSGIEPTFAEEIALDIDEDADNVSVTINYLQSVGLLEQVEDGYQMPYVTTNIGSETASAQRVREHRALHCNKDVTQVKQLCNVEKEIEKEIEIEKDIDIIKPKTKRFVKPTIEEIKQYCIERNNNVDPERFYNFYESKGWVVGKSAMKDWKAAVRNWEKSRIQEPQKKVYTIDESQPEEIPIEQLRERMFRKK